MTDLLNPIFTDADKAREHLESLRWPSGPVCPHCGNSDRAKIRALQGKSHRKGLYQCAECREQFTVTVGTVFERSKIPLNKWMLATHLMAASKVGMSAHQLHRMLGVTYKTAWFMAHRIREAMGDDAPAPMGGGEGGQVQADETYIAGSKRAKGYQKGHRHLKQVVALVDPSTGAARSFAVKTATAEDVREIVVTNADRKSTLVTDESRLYTKVGAEFAGHKKIKHATGKYVSKDGFTTNNVENYFGILKRGVLGTFFHVSEKHLQMYLKEFDFRYTNRAGKGVADVERRDLALKGISGKRLTYRRPDEAALA